MPRQVSSPRSSDFSRMSFNVCTIRLRIVGGACGVLDPKVGYELGEFFGAVMTSAVGDKFSRDSTLGHYALQVIDNGG